MQAGMYGSVGIVAVAVQDFLTETTGKMFAQIVFCPAGTSYVYLHKTAATLP